MRRPRTCSISSAEASSSSSPASCCRSAPSSANSACCRRRKYARSRWNAWKQVSSSVSATARSRSSTCRTRRSASTSFASPARGCFRTSTRCSSGWTSRRRPLPSRSQRSGPGANGESDRGILSSLRYLFADFIGEEDETPPFLPEGLPDPVLPVASNAIHLLIDYQSTSYAQLYVDRLRRFVGKPGVDDAMFTDIARLMAARMSYLDPIRIAQLKLAESDEAAGNAVVKPAADVRKFRIDELVSTLPAIVAQPLLDGLEWAGWLHKPFPIRFSTASRWGIRRLKMEAGLRRWRRYSVRYAKERIWVERWLHMIDRSLTKQPAAASEIVQTAAMIRGTAT